MKNWNYYILAVMVVIVASCTPKVVEKIEDKSHAVEIPELSEEQKMCRTFDQLGSRRNEALEAFVLYRDLVKAKNYTQAYPLWKKAFHMAPKSDGKKTYHYDDGVKIFKHFYDVATTENEKQMWVDSVKFLYERREMCFGNGTYLASRQGYDMYFSFKNNVSNQYIFDLFKKSADEQGKELPYFVISPFSKILVDMVADTSLQITEASKYANILLNAIEYGNKNCGDDCETWEIINNYAPNRLEVLEGYPGLYDCDYYYNKYYSEYLENPMDCETIEKVGIRLRRGGCDIDGEALQILSTAFKTNCKKEVVKEKGPLGEAFDLYRNGDYKGAVTKFDEYFAIETDAAKLAKFNLVVAKICYRDIKNFPQARKYALEAASHKEAWGEPYIIIGKLYASSGPICGPGTGWKSQIVTWPAIDKWKYAKKIDPTVSKEANRLIKTYEKYMPSIEDVFSRPKATVGKSFHVACWINENTIVRAAK